MQWWKKQESPCFSCGECQPGRGHEMKALVIMAAAVVFLAFIFALTAAVSCKSDDEKKDEDREQEEWILKTRKEKKWKINRKE